MLASNLVLSTSGSHGVQQVVVDRRRVHVSGTCPGAERWWCNPVVTTSRRLSSSQYHNMYVHDRKFYRNVWFLTPPVQAVLHDHACISLVMISRPTVFHPPTLLSVHLGVRVPRRTQTGTTRRIRSCLGDTYRLDKSMNRCSDGHFCLQAAGHMASWLSLLASSPCRRLPLLFLFSGRYGGDSFRQRCALCAVVDHI